MCRIVMDLFQMVKIIHVTDARFLSFIMHLNLLFNLSPECILITFVCGDVIVDTFSYYHCIKFSIPFYFFYIL